MNLLCVKDYQEMSKRVAGILLERIKTTDKITLGLATGSTPIGIYEELVKDHKENHTSYKHVTTFNLDEYIGIETTHPNSYHYYMNQKLFSHTDILKENIHLPKGNAKDLKAECLRYEKSIQDAGGIDVQILGLGENGHIGFNEPGASIKSFTHIVELTDSTRRANARFFSSLKEVPTHAITMGISSILQSKEILLVVSGKKKATALSHLLESDEADSLFPASALILHPNVTIIADEACASQLAIC